MPNGIIVVDKPAGWTSHDVVAKLRRILGERRIGHAGTLDPMATGVLPVFVGRATRAVEFAQERGKEYLAGLRLGLTTDTQDVTGETLLEKPCSFTADELEPVLARFRGDILQIPPMYSALKQQGKKLYELAREGKTVDRPPRPVTLYELVLLEQSSPRDFLLRAACSKGTYLGTLCHDIGEALGVGGCLSSLRRTRAAGFTLEEAVTLEALLEHPDPQSLLRPVDSYFASLTALTVSASGETKIRNGNPVSHDASDGDYRVYSGDGTFLMVGSLRDGTLTTIKSFFEV